jgi:hypothetical protein
LTVCILSYWHVLYLYGLHGKLNKLNWMTYEDRARLLLKNIHTMCQSNRCHNTDNIPHYKFSPTWMPLNLYQKILRQPKCGWQCQFRKTNYRTCSMFFTDTVLNITCFFHQLCAFYVIFSLSYWGNEIWNTYWEETLSI